jgi:hypothetical protein
MFQFLVDLLSSAYVELVILIAFVVYLVIRRRDRLILISGIRWVRLIIVTAIFIYFLFIWASTVQPTLRTISIFGMFVINLYMAYSLLLCRLEAPYRQALRDIGLHPDRHETLHTIWHTGKKFYYTHYWFSSLFSGTHPFNHLHSLAVERVRNDIKDELHRFGVEKKLVSLDVLKAYLQSRLACDQELPVEFKELTEKSIEDFSKHPWIAGNVNNFLQIATETPEDLHFPEWMARFEACVREYKK